MFAINVYKQHSNHGYNAVTFRLIQNAHCFMYVACLQSVRTTGVTRSLEEAQWAGLPFKTLKPHWACNQSRALHSGHVANHLLCVHFSARPLRLYINPAQFPAPEPWGHHNIKFCIYPIRIYPAHIICIYIKRLLNECKRIKFVI